ncbi:hypothetical protein F5882DRAFT_465355 [Hyaloscypha sp. PMI_1271]|nr:hypothetical protein F5882DRAFT_465355 [Hyaloscypha sp. PMI_1271]
MVLCQYLRFTGTGPVASPLQDIPGALGGILGSELGGFIWMVLLFKDRKKARMMKTSWCILLAGHVASVIVIGPGVKLLAAWLWREETLATTRHWAAVTKAE